MPTINLGRTPNRVPTSNKKAAQKIYQDPRWKAVREEKLRLNPVCERCESEGKTSMAEEIHHIIPFSQSKNIYSRERLAFDLDNLESLCTSCHQKHHKKSK